MGLYLDTSAVMPYYREAPASNRVQSLLRSQRKPVLISQLTQMEFASALSRWVRTGELTDPQANRIETVFFEDVSEQRFAVEPLTGPHYERASHWLATRKTALRTLDALHLACAAANEATLVTLDSTMLAAADYFGLRTQSLS